MRSESQFPEERLLKVLENMYVEFGSVTVAQCVQHLAEHAHVVSSSHPNLNMSLESNFQERKLNSLL